jgi:hypothetical protein
MSIADDIADITKRVTKRWTAQRKREERGRPRCSRAYVYSDRVTFTDVADRILPQAYAHASGGGRYSVSKRQLFYACRKAFNEQATNDGELEYGYFAGTLLVQYMNRHPDLGWKITADPRGTLVIPNAGHEVRVPVGTIAIDNHLHKAARRPDTYADANDAGLDIEWPSLAAGQRYRAVVYLEKEGFEPLLKEAKIAERFDVAVMSCKGQSVVAARRFVDTVCAAGRGVPLLVVHDMDKAGFEISQRLTSVSHWAEENDRVAYRFQNAIHVIDVGLKLADAEAYGLEGEPCDFKGDFAADSIATEEEQEYLRSGRRVELNEFTSPDFIKWFEGFLTEHLGKERLIPGDRVLEEAYRRAMALAEINRAIDRVRGRAIERANAALVPADLRRRLARRQRRSAKPWDAELYELALKEVRKAAKERREAKGKNGKEAKGESKLSGGGEG